MTSGYAHLGATTHPQRRKWSGAVVPGRWSIGAPGSGLAVVALCPATCPSRGSIASSANITALGLLQGSLHLRRTAVPAENGLHGEGTLLAIAYADNDQLLLALQVGQ